MRIAIVSTNKDKYSETFIQNHVKHLPGSIYFLFDGYLPKQYSEDRGITADFLIDNLKPKWYSIRKDVKYQQLYAIEKYLKKAKVEVILCEFGPSGVEMLPIAQKLNIPLVVHFHGYDAYRDDVLTLYGKRYSYLFDYAGAIIVVSKHMYSQLIKLGCSSDKLHKLNYGIDTSIFKIDNTQRSEHLFVACGRFVEKKAPQNTIQAFKLVTEKFPKAKLLMIGDGELFNLCQELVIELELSQSVEFRGVLDQQEIADIYNNATAFVQHSVTSSINDSEGTPLSIIEAMACGLPIIATNHAGIPDIIADGQNGFLVDQHDVEGMTNKMVQILSNPENAKLMGQKGAKKALKDHDLLNYIFDLGQILQIR